MNTNFQALPNSQLDLSLGHSNTLKCFDLTHSVVTPTAYLGSLSCKLNIYPSTKSFADCKRLSSKIGLYLAPSSFPDTAKENHPHSMMLLQQWIHGDGVIRMIYSVKFLPHVLFSIKAKIFNFGLI